MTKITSQWVVSKYEYLYNAKKIKKYYNVLKFSSSQLVGAQNGIRKCQGE